MATKAPSADPGETTTFSIVLHSDCEVSARLLRLAAFPETVAELQRHVEAEFNVPQCCQSVFFEALQLRSNESLRVHRVRSGDTFQVHYKTEADVEDIRGVVDTIRGMITTIEGCYDQHPHYYDPNKIFLRQDFFGVFSLLDQQIKPDTVECLAGHYFRPFTSERTIANRLFFLDIGGLELLHKLHCIVLRYPWHVTVLSLQCLEQAILRILWNITASFDVRSQVLKYPFMELCMKSAQRVPILYKKSISPPKHLAYRYYRPNMDHEQQRILGEVIYKAFGVLFNLAELPECQVPIASEYNLLRQVAMLMLSPSYKYIASLVSVAGLVCLAYKTETHQHLVKRDIMEGVVEATCMPRSLYGVTQEEVQESQTLLRYFASLLFAQILTLSLDSVAKETLPRLCSFIEDFLTAADPETLHDYEQKNGYIWSTIRPHLNLAYFPINAQHRCSTELVIKSSGVENLFAESDAMSYTYVYRDPDDMSVDDDDTEFKELQYTIHTDKLYLQCVEVGVISLQNMMLEEKTRTVLRDEELVDYVLCMPWFLPPGSAAQRRARELVRSLGANMKLEPPRLVNIARAKLAADTFGLERTLQAYSVHDLIYS